MLQVDNTYVCHWSKLLPRKQYISAHLQQAGITNIQYVECFDKENWNENEILKEYPKAFDIINGDTRKMRYSELSLVLKHCWIIKDIVKNNYNTALILEDDAKLRDNFIEDYNNFSTHLPPEWDVCWVGSCCNINAVKVPGQYVYVGDRSRCTHTFVVSLGGAKKMIPMLHTLDAPADHFYNKLIREIPLNNFWFEPPLAEQNTIFKTSIHTES